MDLAPSHSLDHRSPAAVEGNFLNDFSMRALNAGHALYSHRRHLNAIMAFKYGLIHDPSELRLHMMLVITYRSLGKNVEKKRQLDIITRLRPPANIAGLIENTIETWNYVPDLTGDLPFADRNENPYLTSSLFGVDGEFGNQIFQYAFLKLYAEKYGLILELNPWMGNQLFHLWDAPVSRILPFILEIEYTQENMFDVPPWRLGIFDRDTQGYFQIHTKHLAPFRNKILTLFQPIVEVEVILQDFLRDLRRRGRTLVAIHLRCGDAEGQGRTTDTAVYLKWLSEIMPTLVQPILFLASDDIKKVRPIFAEFNPVTTEEVRLPLTGANYYPDFYLLSHADIVAIGNSTFSFAASMLNRKAAAFVRPSADNSALIPFDPWNAEPIL